ncbi:MAG: 50S ribosomal protein L29 [Deltaproteobacteria bacterium]|nr:50S ribosomal protein L29 [Deltaproteobacteria bacterium]
MAKNENIVLTKELRGRGEAELKSLLDQKSDELSKLGFKHALQQLRETHKLKLLKRDIARIRTVLGERARTPGGES